MDVDDDAVDDVVAIYREPKTQDVGLGVLGGKTGAVMWWVDQKQLALPTALDIEKVELIAGGPVVIASGYEWALTAYDARDGRLMWRRQPPAPFEQVCTTADVLELELMTRQRRAYDLRTGEERTLVGDACSPALATWRDGRDFSFVPADVWLAEGERPWSARLRLELDRVVVPSDARWRYLLGINDVTRDPCVALVDDQRIHWQRKVQRAARHLDPPLAALADGAIVVAFVDGARRSTLAVYERVDGERRWEVVLHRVALEGAQAPRLAVHDAGVVLLSDARGWVHAYDLRTGSLRWSTAP
jgi:hypothetical protein